MADITAGMVKQLREATNVGMMECKRALTEAGGDMDKAMKLLREMGLAVAAKKSTRATNQGLIATAATEDGACMSLIEVNCETDFVARNQNFIDFVANLARQALDSDEPLADRAKDDVVAKVAEIGENINVRRNTRFQLQGTGLLMSYIHLGGKVGVLIEVGCEKAETVAADAFQELAKDLCLHVAAASPQYLTADEVPQDVVAEEREIFSKQVKDKPAQIIDKIVDGKMNKFYAEVCLLDQGFVKEPKQSITELLAETGKAVGDTPVIRRFVRYQLGS
jgi:elongation factor Ts